MALPKPFHGEKLKTGRLSDLLAYAPIRRSEVTYLRLKSETCVSRSLKLMKMIPYRRSLRNFHLSSRIACAYPLTILATFLAQCPIEITPLKN